MEIIEIGYLLELIMTPYGISVVCLMLSSLLITKFNIDGKMKVFTPWIVGSVLSVIMLALGKYINFGAYAIYEFNTWKDWAIFVLVAVSPGCISNSIYDTKLLKWLLKLFGVSKDDDS